MTAASPSMLADDTSGAAKQPESPPLRYAPALDGLRGLAVAAVVLYHHDSSWLPGGFLGVDVFFVLSGFLITSILLGSGRSRLGAYLAGFWSRRSRRLAPPLVITLALVAFWAAWLAPPELAGRVRADGISSLFQVANWRFVLEGQSYFAEFIPSPLRHLWSLSVEMQWYLVWPLVVFALGAVFGARRLPGAVAITAGLLAGGSTMLMASMHEAGTDPSRLYYGTDTHAAPLLIGALLAALVTRERTLDPAADDVKGRRSDDMATTLVGFGAVAVLLVAMTTATGLSSWLYLGGFAGVALATAVLVVCLLHPSPRLVSQPLAWLLATPPLRFLGRISYGVYLYHWPLYFIITPDRTGLEDGWLFAARAAITLVFATVSYVLVEQPIRTRIQLRPVPSAAAMVGAAATTVALLLVATASLPTTWADRDDASLELRPLPVASTAAPPVGTSEDEPIAADPVAVPRDARVLVVGDSMAYSLALGFEEGVGAEHDLLVWNQGILYCELLSHPRRESGVEEHAADPRCENWPERWAEFVTMFDPDLAVVLIGPWEVFDRRIDGDWVGFGDPLLDDVLRHQFRHAVDILSSKGARVVFLTVPPLDRTDGVSASEWTIRERWRVDHLNVLLASIVDESPERAGIVDLGALVCPDDTCGRALNDVTLRGDGIHYTTEGARALATELAPLLATEAEMVLSGRSAQVAPTPENAAPEGEPADPDSSPEA